MSIEIHTTSNPVNIGINTTSQPVSVGFNSAETPVVSVGTNPILGPTGNGIESITKTSTTGLIDTYTITYTYTSPTTFIVTNGTGIASIEKTSTSGLVDTYTITLTNGETTTFDVTNGEKGDTGNSGVQVSTTEPTDTDINVWLNPDGIVGNVSAFVNDAGYITKDVNNLTYYTKTSSLATVATSGSYNDLSNKLTAGTGISIVDNVISNTQVSAVWGNITGTLSSQTDLKNVLDDKQDEISDLTDIRTGAGLGATAVQPADLGNGTLTIQANGTTLTTFTANQSTNATVNVQFNKIAISTTEPLDADIWLNPDGTEGCFVDDSSTTSTNLGWSASKLNSIIGDIETAINTIRGV